MIDSAEHTGFGEVSNGGSLRIRVGDYIQSSRLAIGGVYPELRVVSISGSSPVLEVDYFGSLVLVLPGTVFSVRRIGSGVKLGRACLDSVFPSGKKRSGRGRSARKTRR